MKSSINIILAPISELSFFLKNYPEKRIIVITDQNVDTFHSDKFSDFPKIVIDAGESQKNILQIEKIAEKLLELGADRTSVLVGIGGGVVCDICGFIASIFMRGIQFCYVPTTLLAQVDAAIGGKTGVNTSKIKNVLGTFNMPEFTLVDYSLLQTLAPQELINGMAEVVKHACISDESYFGFLENNYDKILAQDSFALTHTISKSIEIKKEIVEQDPEEKGLRKLLNYGHTFGHAIEKHYQITHGFAIAKGISIINKIALELGILTQENADRIYNLNQQIGLNPEIESIDIQELLPYITNDKKKTGAKISLVVVSSIGQSEVLNIPYIELEKIISTIWK
jgi:3-dehydroquinate synthase